LIGLTKGGIILIMGLLERLNFLRGAADAISEYNQREAAKDAAVAEFRVNISNIDAQARAARRGVSPFNILGRAAITNQAAAAKNEACRRYQSKRRKIG
jgi:hypothetical protein